MKSLIDEIMSVLPQKLQSTFRDEVQRRNPTESEVINAGPVDDTAKDVNFETGPRVPAEINWNNEELTRDVEATVPETNITQQLPINIPQPEAPEIFPETQELMAVTDALTKEASNLRGTVAQAGRPTPTNPMEVGIASLTPADFEAAMQLMRGEPPTANLQQHLNAEAIRTFG